MEIIAASAREAAVQLQGRCVTPETVLAIYAAAGGTRGRAVRRSGRVLEGVCSGRVCMLVRHVCSAGPSCRRLPVSWLIEIAVLYGRQGARGGYC